MLSINSDAVFQDTTHFIIKIAATTQACLSVVDMLQEADVTQQKLEQVYLHSW